MHALLQSARCLRYYTPRPFHQHLFHLSSISPTSLPSQSPTSLPSVSPILGISFPSISPTSLPSQSPISTSEPTAFPTPSPISYPNCNYKKKYATTFTGVGSTWTNWYNGKVKLGKNAFLDEYPWCGDASSLEFFYEFVYYESARTLTFYAQ
eukprot:849936_1